MKNVLKVFGLKNCIKYVFRFARPSSCAETFDASIKQKYHAVHPRLGVLGTDPGKGLIVCLKT